MGFPWPPVTLRDLPRPQAIDVWTGVCLTFVFGALLEFALVNYASRSDIHREQLKKLRRQTEVEQQMALEADHLEADPPNTFAMVSDLWPSVRARGIGFSNKGIK